MLRGGGLEGLNATLPAPSLSLFHHPIVALNRRCAAKIAAFATASTTVSVTLAFSSSWPCRNSLAAVALIFFSAR